jgi:hypothetical protein
MEKSTYRVSKEPSCMPPSLSSPIGIYTKPATDTQCKTKKQRSFLFGNVIISEEPSNFSIPLKKKDQERYLNSFLKKKLLQLWKKHRHILSVSHPSEEKTNQERKQIYEELKMLLIQSYEEDFNIPLIPFTLFGWLQYVKLTAQITGKAKDAKQWDEMALFFQQCHKNHLLTDLFEQRPVNKSLDQ